MNYKHTFVYCITAIMLAIPFGLQADPPPGILPANSLAARVAALEAQNTAQQQEINALTTKLACVTSTSNGTEFVLEGCNVHVRNGGGQTDSVNGFGNLIIGYNEDVQLPMPKDRTGSHNLVVGPEHTYSNYGGFVAGLQNSVTGANASVSGGATNEASGVRSSVSGGSGNEASGVRSSVSGGSGNEASGSRTSVSGGASNWAGGLISSVSGGSGNVASGNYSSILGGDTLILPIGSDYVTIPGLP